MSEAAPGYPDSIAFVSEERARLAEAVRGLIDATMTVADATPEALAAAAAAVETVTQSLVGDVDRTSGPGYNMRSHGDYLPRSPVVGAASPMSPGSIDWDIVDGRCIATGVMTAAYEGPPGYVHGGMVALVFDEVLGIVNIANGCPGMTGTLSVKYRRPTPLYQPLRWEAWIERRVGRRVVSKATVWHGEVLCAEADGVFIEPNEDLRRQYFGDTASG